MAKERKRTKMDTKTEQFQKDVQDLKNSQKKIVDSFNELKEILKSEVDLKVSKAVLSQTNSRFSAIMIQIGMLTLVTGIFFYISNSHKAELKEDIRSLKEDIRSNTIEIKELQKDIKDIIKVAVNTAAKRKPGNIGKKGSASTEKDFLDKSKRKPTDRTISSEKKFNE